MALTSEQLRDWCDRSAGGARIVYARDGETPIDVMAEARDLEEAGLVRLFHKKDRATGRFVRLAVRRARGLQNKQPAAPKPEKVAVESVKCPVPGCRRRLGPKNTSGVCIDHKHHADFCRCPPCEERRGAASWQALAAAGKTLTEAARERGVTTATASRYAVRLGLRFRDGRIRNPV